MPKVYDQKERRYVEVKNIKNITSPKHPGWEFFVHRNIDVEGDGFMVTEKTSGASVGGWALTVKKKIAQALERLEEITPEQLSTAVTNAINRQVKEIKEREEAERNE